MSTFIELTNQTLRRLNEVEVTPGDFASVRGVQALAKDAVKNSIAKINQAETNWPFNAAEHDQFLVVAQEEYAWPPFFKSADWSSFQIQKDPNLGVDYRRLNFISTDQWYIKYRDRDYSSDNQGISIPEFVFPSHGFGFGVSPSPDKAYRIRFRYYLAPVNLVAATDTPRVPTVFDHVIVEGALYYMYMFKDNVESTQVASFAFQQGVSEMRTLLINRYDRMYDTRVAY
jgi:hypothetical protein